MLTLQALIILSIGHNNKGDSTLEHYFKDWDVPMDIDRGTETCDMNEIEAFVSKNMLPSLVTDYWNHEEYIK